MRVFIVVLLGVLAVGCGLSPNIDLPSKDRGGDGSPVFGSGDGDDGQVNIPPSGESPGVGPGGAPCAFGGAGGASETSNGVDPASGCGGSE